jgi:hypothetical protein
MKNFLHQKNITNMDKKLVETVALLEKKLKYLEDRVKALEKANSMHAKQLKEHGVQMVHARKSAKKKTPSV